MADQTADIAPAATESTEQETSPTLETAADQTTIVNQSAPEPVAQPASTTETAPETTELANIDGKDEAGHLETSAVSQEVPTEASNVEQSSPPAETTDEHSVPENDSEATATVEEPECRKIEAVPTCESTPETAPEKQNEEPASADSPINEVEGKVQHVDSETHAEPNVELTNGLETQCESLVTEKNHAESEPAPTSETTVEAAPTSESQSEHAFETTVVPEAPCETNPSPETQPKDASEPDLGAELPSETAPAAELSSEHTSEPASAETPSETAPAAELSSEHTSEPASAETPSETAPATESSSEHASEAALAEVQSGTAPTSETSFGHAPETAPTSEASNESTPLQPAEDAPAKETECLVASHDKPHIESNESLEKRANINHTTETSLEAHSENILESEAKADDTPPTTQPRDEVISTPHEEASPTIDESQDGTTPVSKADTEEHADTISHSVSAPESVQEERVNGDTTSVLGATMHQAAPAAAC
ncbi:hypothetical protein DICVIV_09496 [Dictyocaulus viviparus]|uniref:Uncharacterized protein n=1 Tax=Dictyocaulus viviparus TaxID=29172 RepID=A0A0D8XIQ4_DICVI|nr:hypothetical protein DICVIV_09496 [Dictyocaulus viviparus]